MSKLFLLSPILLFCFSAKLPAQTNFWNSPDAYFGQIPPTDTPKIFGPKILADSGIVLGTVAFSKNGKEFYYTYARSWFDRKGSGVKQIIYDGKKWNEPKVLFEELSNPSLSIDENKMFFGGTGSTVWQSERINNKWNSPVVLYNKSYGLYNFQPTNSGVFYAGSNANKGNKNDFSTYDFCTLTISKTDTAIQSLGKPLNTPGFDGDFYIAPDESYIIISAKETPTYESELYISFRKADKTWTNPKSLGPAINDGLAHRFGQYVTPDKKYLIYTKGTSEKDCNLYWVRFDQLLQKLKPKS
jgi:hypothetical protein